MNETSKLLVDPAGAPLDRIVGFETEYGISWQSNASGKFYPVEDHTLHSFMRSNKADYEQYRSNGNRRYIDLTHPELSTAEDIDFLQAGHRVLAGHFEMAKLFSGIPAFVNMHELLVRDIRLASNSCDAAGNSWSSHENYLARRELEPEYFISALAAHNLSRIVWSGAGHVQLGRGQQSYRFVLSEKAEHIWEVYNNNSTAMRALVNMRDEPLADPSRFRRIHNITGESVFSPFANGLRLASASIVLRACEVGVNFDDLLPINPIRAIRDISGDPTLKARVEMENGRLMTGLEIQKAIAERCVHILQAADYITPQERQWAKKWLQVLDDLSTDIASCASRADWVVKQNLIEREVATQREKNKTLSSEANTRGPKKQNLGMVALAKSFGYHHLLPTEGIGMMLIRRGFFDDSPSVEMLEGGLPLPDTRAKIRGEAIARVIELGLEVPGSTWSGLWFINKNISTDKFPMLDPYVTENPELDEYIDKLAA